MSSEIRGVLRPSMSGAGEDLPSRLPSLDIARGFMLLLIAVANIYWWFPDLSPVNTADQWWVVARTSLVDQRSYPLFAILFGYGLASISMRREMAGIDEGPIKRLLRRRGWWMLAIGLAHAILFGGDIIGTYAVIAILTAGLIVSKRLRWLTAIASMVWLTAFLLGGALQINDRAGDNMQFRPGSADLTWIPANVFMWLLNTPLTIVVSMALPATVIGIWLAQTSLLSSPERHLPLLWSTAVGGLAIGSAGGFIVGLHRSGLSDGAPPVWASLLNSATSLMGAMGWLGIATLVGYAARDRLPSKSPYSPIGMMVATGKRSMTSYLMQTLLFIPIVIILRTTGAYEGISLITLAGIAVAVWLMISLICATMEFLDYPGPSELLLRKLVANTSSAHDRALLYGKYGTRRAVLDIRQG